MSLKVIRYKLALAVFGIILIWPIIHMALINVLPISSWRFFGWGMYATPSPEDQTRIRVVIAPNLSPSTNLKELHKRLNATSSPLDESNCVNIFLIDDGNIKRSNHSGLCQNETFLKNREYFLHFGSEKHLAAFINHTLEKSYNASSTALAFLTHQRFNLLNNNAYLESEIYKISDNNIIYLGRFSDKRGEENEGENL